MKKKDILLFIPSIEDGGVEKNFYIISNYLEKKHKSIQVITTKKVKRGVFKNIKIINPLINLENLQSRKIKYLFCILILIKKILFNKNYLVFAFQANLYCIILCKLLGIKVITRSNSSPEGWSKNPIKFYLYKKISSFADKIIVNSIEFKKEFKKKFSINTKCILNPLDKKEILKKSKIKVKKIFSKNKLKLITVGRLVDQKNHISILKALNKIKGKVDFELIIIGKGNLKNVLVEYINRNNLEKYIKILNFKKNPYPYIKQAEIFLLSSKFEGLPNVLLESQVLKKYIISCDCPTGPKEILLDGKAGDLFKINDHNNLANLILGYKKNKFKNIQKIKLGYNYLNRYNFIKNLKEYDKTISQYL